MTLLQMSVMGTVLICLMAILRRLAADRLPPGCYLLLWLAIGLRMLVPVHIASPFSVYNLLVRNGVVFTPENFTFSTRFISEPAAEPFDTNAAVHMVFDGGLQVNWLAVVWAIGAAGCFFFALLRHIRTRKQYAVSLPVEDAFVQQWKADHPLMRSYQIRQSRYIDTPLTYGVICPVILLPADQMIEERALNMMLLHEWNHIRHWDVFWQWMMVLLCSIHWFNPTVWMMCMLSRQDLELFCDRATVQQLSGNQRREYALLLLQQAGAVSSSAPFFSQFCFTGYHRMEERMKVIMKPAAFNKKTLAITAGLLCVGTLCFATTAMGEINGENQQIDTNIAAIQQDKEPQLIPIEGSRLVWPVQSEEAEVTLNYGVRVHPITGETMTLDHISIGGVEKGTDIIAAASGVVKEAGYDASRGNYLIIQCADELETRYWHCETLLAEEGDTVSACQVIATLGQTGDATGPCLSFAVYQDGEAVDPMEWLE